MMRIVMGMLVGMLLMAVAGAAQTELESYRVTAGAQAETIAALTRENILLKTQVEALAARCP